MEYTVFMEARQRHEEHVQRLTQSYADAQQDTESLKMLLSNGAAWIGGLFRTDERQSRQDTLFTGERRSGFAPVILDEKRGDSW